MRALVLSGRPLALLALLSAASLAGADGGTADAGVALLLGIDNSGHGLSTVRVTEAGVELLGPGLAVPTRSGWLRISEVGTTVDSSLVVTRGELARSVAERAGKKVAKSRTRDECTHASGEQVLSVTPIRLVSEQWGASMCEGQNHPEHTTRATAVSLGKTGKGEPEAIQAVLGPAARAALDRATGFEDRDSYGDWDPAAWSFAHAEGVWRVVVYDRPSNPNAGLVPLTLDLVAPPALVGIERLPGTWAELKAAHPEATDAIGAPDGRFLVLITSEGVVALRSDGSELGRVSLHKPLVVMTQWALGEGNAARWGREARAVLSR
jgi:hypothetical protein